jgi:hypothetical protein
VFACKVNEGSCAEYGDRLTTDKFDVVDSSLSLDRRLLFESGRAGIDSGGEVG